MVQSKKTLFGRVTVNLWDNYYERKLQRDRAEAVHRRYFVPGCFKLDGRVIALIGHRKASISGSQAWTIFTTRAPFRMIGRAVGRGALAKAAFDLARKRA